MIIRCYDLKEHFTISGKAVGLLKSSGFYLVNIFLTFLILTEENYITVSRAVVVIALIMPFPLKTNAVFYIL